MTQSDPPGDRSNDNSSDTALLETLAPSELLTLKVLLYEGPLTIDELCAETRLSKRTLQYALSTLKEESLVTKVPHSDNGSIIIYKPAENTDLPPRFTTESSAREDIEFEDCNEPN